MITQAIDEESPEVSSATSTMVMASEMEKQPEAVPLRNPELGTKEGKNTEPIEDYDPHKHRVVENPTSNFETLVHLLKCSLGTGILAMPQAFAKTGLVNGIIGTVLVGILVTYCLHLLVNSQYQICKRKRVPLLTYPESMRIAFNIGPHFLKPVADISAPIVDFFLVVYQLGICCVYIVFIAETFKRIIDPYFTMAIEIYMLIILGPLILINMIRDLKRLAPFSSAANIMTFAGLAVVVYYLLTGTKSKEPVDYWGNIAQYPLFFGTALFALTAVGVVVALENNMADPKAFGRPMGVLNVGMGFIVILYATIGSLGYVYCTSECKDSITLNLPSTWLPAVVLILFAIAIFISYVLQCYPPVDIVWRSYMRPRLITRQVKNLLLWEYGLRIFLCILTFIFAVAVPRLGLFISLFGALCLSVLGIIFPALLEVCIKWDQKPSPLMLIKNIMLMLIGLMGMIVGTYSALAAIVRSFM